MDSIFDIFKVTSDGPLWVEAVQGLEKAKERMARLAVTSPGDYFIYSQEKGVVAKSPKNEPRSSDDDEQSLLVNPF